MTFKRNKNSLKSRATPLKRCMKCLMSYRLTSWCWIRPTKLFMGWIWADSVIIHWLEMKKVLLIGNSYIWLTHILIDRLLKMTIDKVFESAIYLYRETSFVVNSRNNRIEFQRGFNFIFSRYYRKGRYAEVQKTYLQSF